MQTLGTGFLLNVETLKGDLSTFEESDNLLGITIIHPLQHVLWEFADETVLVKKLYNPQREYQTGK